MARNERLWAALDRFRTSRWGVLLFYAYLVGVLLCAIIAVAAINGNHTLAIKARDAARKANGAAAKANTAAEIGLRSLCFQKRAGINQLRGARQFLADHPDGTPDFSRALIVNAIHNDEIDVAALHDVHCGPASKREGPNGSTGPAGPLGPTGVQGPR